MVIKKQTNFRSAIKSVFDIIRPVNVAITFASSLASAYIVSVRFNFDVLFIALSAVFASAASNVINDIFDIETDRINRPNRTIPSGRLSKQSAIIYYIFLVALGGIFAFWSSYLLFILYIISSICIFFYSFKLKSIPLIGNFAVAFFTAFVFLYCGFGLNRVDKLIFPAIFAFLVNFSREIIKDIEDIEGDTYTEIITFPKKYGLNKSKVLIFFITLLLIISTFIPIVLGFYNVLYLSIIAFTVVPGLVVFLIMLRNAKNKSNYTQMSLLLKIVMVFGLCAIIGGSFKTL